jgi:hypothetical protein
MINFGSFIKNYLYGSWNALSDSTVVSGDQRRGTAVSEASRALQEVYDKDCLAGVKHFYGIVCHSVDRTHPSAEVKSSQASVSKDGTVGPYPTYKVYVPELEARPIPTSLDDPVLATYQDFRVSEGLAVSPDVGAIVKIRYDDPEKLYGPAIIGVEGSVDPTFVPSSRVGLGSAAGTSTLVGDATAHNPENVLKDYFKRPGKDKSSGNLKHYPPGSEKAKKLLREALSKEGLPTEWADWLELHNILKRESDGMVGIPNYTYSWKKETCADGHKEACFGSGIKNKPHKWPELWRTARQHKWPKKNEDQGKDANRLGSTATGLGQLLSKNVEVFYPGGSKRSRLEGIGKPLPEAQGFVKYIYTRYGDPKVAWSVYSRGGKGAAAVEYTIQNPNHPNYGKTKQKTFKEGY